MFLSVEEIESNEELISLFKDSINSFDEPAIIDKTENSKTHKLYIFEDKKLIYAKTYYILNKEEIESINTFIRLAKII